MRIILTGGITGGHIYPALAIGDQFREKNPGSEILYVGNERGMEKELVPAHGFELRTVQSRSVDRSNIFKMAETVWVTEYGKSQTYRIMKKFRPDLVVSTGSYVSVPVVLAAHKFGAKVFIHEQNAYPGMANKYLTKYAEKVFLGFRDAGKYFRNKNKLEYTGNPVRGEFLEKDRLQARQLLGIPEDDFVLMSFGGSQGAQTINDTAIELIRRYGNREHTTIIFGTGSRYYEDVCEQLRVLGSDNRHNIRVTPYIRDMADTLAASNLVISRSGALSVAEITTIGCPAIFIPSPNVTGDHQYYNAKAVVDNGGAIIVREDADTPERVANMLRELLSDPDILSGMAENSRRSAPTGAAEKIYNGIMSVMDRSNE